VVTANSGRLGSLVLRVQGAFLDMPELTLTRAEARRWFDMDERLCDAVFGVLVDAGVLTRTADGGYARLFPGRKEHAA
jgi:hypothetical protein